MPPNSPTPYLGRDNKNCEALLGRGAATLAKGDTKQAVAELEHMESMYKKSPQVKYELALAYLMAHDRVKGMASLNQALAAGSLLLSGGVASGATGDSRVVIPPRRLTC